MKRKIIIGSRGSDLALWQAEHVKSQLKQIGVDSEIKIIKTQGDKIQHLSFDKLEGKGFFTKEIEDVLISKETDLAVHSHKDLPTTNPVGLIVAAVSDREDPSELMLIRKEAHDPKMKFAVKKGAVIGTSSARRKSQLLAFRDDLEIRDIRGNVPTRIDKLRKGDFDAIMLAAAGVERLKLKLDDLIVIKPATREFIPAPAQGVLALQIREDDKELYEKLRELNNPLVEECIGVERKILNMFDGGCQLPLGSYCYKENGVFKVFAAKADSWNALPKRIYAEAMTTEGLAESIVDKIRNYTPCRVFITREIEKESFFYRVLDANRYQVSGQSLIEVKPIRFTSIPETDWVFFSSKNAVSTFFGQEPLLADKTKFAVIGTGTETALKAYGKEASFVGNSADTAEVGKAFSKLADGKSVLFPQARKSLRSVQKQLSFQTKVFDLFVYSTETRKKIKVTEADVVVFTSPSNVDAFFETHNLNDVQRVISIGHSTAAKLKHYGVADPILPDYPDDAGLAQAVFGLSFN
ncbi:MAG: hydroxymethylbilane synthase [Bacteroidetes bacterium]|nr:hydroxymethylbilane synthase [Bacteroidota bacterium]